jgi:hypothetical protein
MGGGTYERSCESFVALARIRRPSSREGRRHARSRPPLGGMTPMAGAPSLSARHGNQDLGCPSYLLPTLPNSTSLCPFLVVRASKTKEKEKGRSRKVSG